MIGKNSEVPLSMIWNNYILPTFEPVSFFIQLKID